MKKIKEEYWLYIGVCLAVLPVIWLRDFTPSNELRYLSIADEALRNHTFFAFTNHGVPYADKPPLYLWLVMLLRWISGAHHMWLLALLSLLPAIGIVHVMDRWTAHETEEKYHSLARLMLLTSGLFIGSAITLRMDILMCLFIVLALESFWRMWKEPDTAGCHRWLFPLYIFLAVFTKGPLGFFIPLCGTLVFLAVSKQIRQFFRFWGLRTWGVLLLCCAVWFGAVYAEGGSEYLHNLLFHQTLDRAVNSFHHDAPFYYYAISIWYSIAPWSLLAVGLIVVALCPKFVKTDLERYYLTIGITTFVLLSCFSAKLQIYMLPAFPFMVYVAAMLLPRFRKNGWICLALAVPAFVFAVAFPALIGIAIAGSAPSLCVGWFYAAALVLTLSAGCSLYLLYKKGESEVVEPMRSLGFGLLLAVFVGGWGLEKMNPEIGYGALCDKALEMSQERGITDFRTWRVSRPENMDVYLQHPVTVISEEDSPSFESGRPYLLLIRKGDMEQFSGKRIETVGSYAIVEFTGK